MAADSVVRARIDAASKKKAAEALGRDRSVGFRFDPPVLVRIAAGKEFPFAVKTPNATTRKAMTELETGKGKRFTSADELFKDLGV